MNNSSDRDNQFTNPSKPVSLKIKPQPHKTLVIPKPAQCTIVNPNLKKQIHQTLLTLRIKRNHITGKTQRLTVKYHAVQVYPRLIPARNITERERNRQLQSPIIRHKRIYAIERRQTTRSPIKTVSTRLSLITQLHLNLIITKIPKMVSQTQKNIVAAVSCYVKGVILSLMLGTENPGFSKELGLRINQKPLKRRRSNHQGQNGSDNYYQQFIFLEFHLPAPPLARNVSSRKPRHQYQPQSQQTSQQSTQQC